VSPTRGRPGKSDAGFTEQLNNTPSGQILNTGLWLLFLYRQDKLASALLYGISVSSQYRTRIEAVAKLLYSNPAPLATVNKPWRAGWAAEPVKQWGQVGLASDGKALGSDVAFYPASLEHPFVYNQDRHRPSQSHRENAKRQA
jgi:hypothetical protein